MTSPKLCCPHCQQFESRVVNSRPVADNTYIKRRRECANCRKRFYTQERVIVSKTPGSSTAYHI